MSILRGFETSVYIYCKYAGGTTAQWYKVCTIGDLGYTQEKTAIQIKNRASNKIRVLNGMENFSIQLPIQKGTDPMDEQCSGAGFDAYSVVEESYQSDTPLYWNFGGTLGSGGIISGGVTELMICSNFSANDPVDDVSAATATLGISATSATTANTPPGI